MSSAPDVARILGGEKTLRKRVRSLEDLRQLVEAGLPVESLESTMRHLGGETEKGLELKYRIVPRSTLQRRKRRLNVQESERLERLARLVALAEEVWEDADHALEFLMSGQPQLGGERPVDLARSDLGTRQVEQLLRKIELSLPV